MAIHCRWADNRKHSLTLQTLRKHATPGNPKHADVKLQQWRFTTMVTNSLFHSPFLSTLVFLWTRKTQPQPMSAFGKLCSKPQTLSSGKENVYQILWKSIQYLRNISVWTNPSTIWYYSLLSHYKNPAPSVSKRCRKISPYIYYFEAGLLFFSIIRLS